MGLRGSIVNILISAFIMAFLIEFAPTTEMPFITKVIMCLFAIILSKFLSKILGG